MPLYLENETIIEDFTNSFFTEEKAIKNHVYMLGNLCLPYLLTVKGQTLQNGQVVSGKVEFGEIDAGDEKISVLILLPSEEQR